MSWGVVAVVGANLVGSAMSADAVGDGADTQSDATNRATEEQRRQFDLTREDYRPYREAGARALGQYETQINRPLTGAEVMRDPGYQFGLQQGQTALDRKIAAMGGRVSGAALKAANRYGTDYATTKYGDAYQRRQDSLNRLAALAGIGQTATAGSAAAGQQSANAISSLISSQGDAAAASRIAQGNIYANSGNQIAGLYSNWMRTPSSGGSGVSNGSLFSANLADDPIGALNSSQGWTF